MNYSCESFMDYVYEEDIVMESVISSIKERLKKICASLYRRCNELYERNKQKHPKIASVFKRLAEFFKRHSNVVERAVSKDTLDRELELIKRKSEEVDENWEELKKQTDETAEDFNKLGDKVRETKSNIMERHQQASVHINESIKSIGKNLKEQKVSRQRNAKALDEINKMLDDFDEPKMTERDKKATQEEEFRKSAKYARKAGVPENKILKTKEDIDRYFTE